MSDDYTAPVLRTFEGQRPRLGRGVWVDPSAVVLGDVEIGADSSIWPQVTIRGDVQAIRIGARTSIQDGTVLHVTHDGPFSPGGLPLHIGDEVTVGHQAILHACRIGNRVLVGMGACIADGAIVEDEVIIGAGALVPPGKHLPSGQLYVGAPARPVRALTDREREFLTYSASQYVHLKDRHIAAWQAEGQIAGHPDPIRPPKPASSDQ